MGRVLAARLMTLGAALFASGTAVCVAWGIYAMNSKPNEAFWEWQGWLGVGLLAVGGTASSSGLLKRDPDSGASSPQPTTSQWCNRPTPATSTAKGGDVDISQKSRQLMNDVQQDLNVGNIDSGGGPVSVTQQVTSTRTTALSVGGPKPYCGVHRRAQS